MPEGRSAPSTLRPSRPAAPRRALSMVPPATTPPPPIPRIDPPAPRAPEPAINYLVPFAALKADLRLVSREGQLRLDIAYDAFLAILRQLLQAAPVDEAWYRSTYPDVAEAIDAGTYRDARHHFVANGYLEGRRPFRMAVDEAWYLEAYPDVQDGIDDGMFASAQDHFARHGYEEGRRPHLD